MKLKKKFLTTSTKKSVGRYSRHYFKLRSLRQLKFPAMKGKDGQRSKVMNLLQEISR